MTLTVDDRLTMGAKRGLVKQRKEQRCMVYTTVVVGLVIYGVRGVWNTSRRRGAAGGDGGAMEGTLGLFLEGG